MIAIARKNLSSLFINPNPFLCNPNVLSFSTWRVKTIIPSPEICDLLINKHQFSPELASLASSRLSKFRNPQRADSVLSFLKENCFTITQLQKIAMYNPRVLGFTIEGLESRLKVFQDLGLSSEEIAKMISNDRSILNSSVANKIIPNLLMLKGLLGSNDEVARLLKRCSWFLEANLGKTLIPNVEILKRCSIPLERILYFLFILPRVFVVKSDIMRKSVDKAIELGVPNTTYAFIHAVGVFNHTSEGMWEVKLQTLRDLGFSDGGIVTMFRKNPIAFSVSGGKLKNKIEFLIATGKYSVADIVTCPVALGCSIENRLEPRLQILRLLESRNLIEKWPVLSAVSILTDVGFCDRFVRPYCDVIGEEHIAKVFVEGRKR